MNLLSKETLIGAASLGAGAVAAKVVQKKLLPLIPVPIIQENENVKNLITLGVGIFTPVLIKGPIGKSFGGGMIAVSVAGLVSPFLSKAGLGDDTFLGEDVFMGQTEDSGILMGATDSFSSPGDDFTSGDSGEMNF